MSLYYESHEEKVLRMLEGLESSVAEMHEAMMMVLKQDAPIRHEEWCSTKDEGLVLCRTCGVKRVYAPMRVVHSPRREGVPSFDEMMRTIPIHPLSGEWLDIMDRYKKYYQRFYKCSNEEANDAGESVRLLLRDGCSLLEAWTAVYEKGDVEKTKSER